MTPTPAAERTVVRGTVDDPSLDQFDGALTPPRRMSHEEMLIEGLGRARHVRVGDVLLWECQSVVVLDTNHFGEHLVVLNGAGQHLDIERASSGFFERIASAAYPRSIKVTATTGSVSRRWDLRPGMRFVSGQSYSGGSMNFRHDIVCEIDVDDETVTWRRVGADDAWSRRTHHHYDFRHSDDDHGNELVRGWLPAWANVQANPERIKRR